MTPFGFLVHIVLLATFSYSTRYYLEQGVRDVRNKNPMFMIIISFVFSGVAFGCFLIFGHSLLSQLFFQS